MSLGSTHHESGLLVSGNLGLFLKCDAGGRWRLDVSPKAQTLIGRRVTVEATRSGFDLLDVHRIYPEGETPAQPYILSWQFGAGVVSALSLLALVILLTTG